MRTALRKLVMPAMWCIMTAFLVGAAPGNIAVQPVSRMSEGWWRARFEQKRAELRQGPVDLLWLGDSITQDWERASDQDWNNFVPGWRQFYGDRHAINLGFKGDSTCHLLWRLQHGELDNILPRVAVVLIGANNFGHIHTDADQTFDGIQAVLDEIHRRLPLTHIVLLGVLPSIRSDWVSRNTALLDRRLQAASKDRNYVTYVDVANLFLSGGRVDATKFIDPRLTPPAPPLHPTAQVQAEMAAAIEPDVARLLGDQVHREARLQETRSRLTSHQHQ